MEHEIKDVKEAGDGMVQEFGRPMPRSLVSAMNEILKKIDTLNDLANELSGTVYVPSAYYKLDYTQKYTAGTLTRMARICAFRKRVQSLKN